MLLLCRQLTAWMLASRWLVVSSAARCGDRSRQDMMLRLAAATYTCSTRRQQQQQDALLQQATSEAWRAWAGTSV